MLKEVKDYIPKLVEMYPDVPKEDIVRIVNYGWRLLYYFNLRGCDTLIQSTSNNYWFYIGSLTKNALSHFSYYIKLLRRKLRVLYSRKDTKWNGYYYFGLTNEEYEDLLESWDKPGRKKSNFTFYNKMSFKILDEAKLYYNWSKCIICYTPIMEYGYSFFKKEIKCKNVNIAFKRTSPCTFKDILISNNNYDII